MANRLKITELDFDQIKNNLKQFLKQQNEFTDYDFEGSGLNVLLDILAYNTHYQAYYLNMVANEAFLDTALLRDSVVSHAKTLGYTPYSKKAPVAIINVEIKSTNSTQGTLTLPRGFGFLSNQIDGRSYKFVVLDDLSVTKANSSYYFENVNIHEGQLVSYNFNYDQSSNPKQFFILPDDSIDIETLKVSVAPAIGNTSLQIYNKVSDIVDVNTDSEVYYIQEHRSGKYEIYFGNDVVGKSLPDGAVVYANYLVTNGIVANKSNNFVSMAGVTDSLSESLMNFIISPQSAATGGSDRETVDEIKFGATSQFSSQNRLVTTKDYESYLKKNYPAIDSVSIWGGEEEIPKVFGKVYVSMKPKNNYFISEAEKLRIVNDILGPKSIVSISTEIRDPDYLYVLVSADVHYNQNRTSLTKEELKSLIKDSVLIYRNSYLNAFGSSLIISKLQEQIDNTDTSIIGNHTILKMQKRFKPIIGINSSYLVRFNNAIHRGTSSLDRIISTQFSVLDSSDVLRTCIFEETPQSYTGISSIDIVNAGYSFTVPPSITITGDGTGATATATIVNGKVQSINITNRGFDYTKATVTISGDGYGAEAVAVIDAKIGTLRTIYYNSLSERKIVNNNAGTIDYDAGLIYINDINILEVLSDDGLIRLTGESKTNLIESVRNTIITIDDLDTAAIDITLQQV